MQKKGDGKLGEGKGTKEALPPVRKDTISETTPRVKGHTVWGLRMSQVSSGGHGEASNSSATEQGRAGMG